MAPSIVCVFCEAKLEPHCGNSWCAWAKCTNYACGGFGIPEKNLWRRPIYAKDDDRR